MPRSPHTEENKTLIKEGKLRCSVCNRVKRVGLFYKKAGNRFGYQIKCRACSNTRKTNRYYIVRKYGLTLDEYAELKGHTSGGCWICGGGSLKSLSIDHNHSNGHVRGLLCMPCNRTLGRWGDDPTKAERAAEYLRDDGAEVAEILGHQPKGAIKDAA